MHHVKVKYKKLRETAVVPCYQSKLAAGMDLHAANSENIPIAPGAIEMIPLGFAMALPDHYEAQVRPRSGLASKFGVTLPNAPGTIDADSVENVAYHSLITAKKCSSLNRICELRK